MKIIILHGDDSEKVYQRLQRFIDVAKKRKMTIKRLDKNANLIESLSSQTLFKEKFFNILYDANKIDKKALKWIEQNSKNLDLALVIVHKGIIRKTLINRLPRGTKVEEYKLEKHVWNFLDSFYPGNAKNAIIILDNSNKTESPQFLFAMLARHLRDLYQVKLNEDSTDLPAWRISKLKKQLSKFDDGELESIISELSKTDIKTKTSKASTKSELDFIIASKLE